MVCDVDYQLIAGELYNMGLNHILLGCIIDHERDVHLWECHYGFARGHVGGKETTRKVLQVGLWWVTLLIHAKEYARSNDVC